jgi:hypothetical protein
MLAVISAAGFILAGISPCCAEAQANSVTVHNRALDTLAKRNLDERAVLSCNQKIRSLARRKLNTNTAFNKCINDYATYRPYSLIPPRVQKLRNEDIASATSRAEREISKALLTFVCTRIQKLIDMQGKPTECRGVENSSDTGVFFELFVEPDSMTKLVTVKIFGKSILLAARQAEYWELHRISFQFVEPMPRDLLLIISIFESRLEKNRDDMKNITFNKMMDWSHDKSIKEFLNRISSAFAD